MKAGFDPSPEPLQPLAAARAGLTGPLGDLDRQFLLNMKVGIATNLKRGAGLTPASGVVVISNETGASRLL